MANFSNLFKTVFVILFLSSYSLCFAAMDEFQPPSQGQQQKPQSAKAQALAERRQQFEQEAATAIPEIEAEYAKFVAYLNSGQTPDDANVRAGLKFVTKNKRYLPLLNKQHNGGTYYALSAWVCYFDNKPEKVTKQIASGIKDSASNTSFLDTAVALSMIYKDYNSVPQILTSLAERLKNAESTNPPQSQDSQLSPNKLNIDVNSIHADALGQPFDIRPATADKDVLCMLLWKVDVNELERFAPPAPKPVQVVDPNNPQPEQPPVETPPAETYTGEPIPMPELASFSNLQNRFSENPKAVFVGINFNDASKIKHLENWLAKNPQKWQIVPPSVQAQNVFSSLLGGTPKKPLLVITGPDSTIRYVGDVNSFLPNMIIKNILANPQEFAEPNNAGTSADSNDPNKPKVVNEPNSAAVTQPAAEVNTMQFLKPSQQDSNQAAPSTAVQTQNIQITAPETASKSTNASDFTEADYEAQKDLEYARTLFQIGNRMQYHTYAKPIELCRSIIAKYPKTKYADEARILLRQVPERFRSRYNITDEELGL